MSVQQVEPSTALAPPAPLTAHYGPVALPVAQDLAPELQHALRRAVGALVRDPYPEQSQALNGTGTERRVRGSQSLTLLYGLSDGHLIVRQIIVLPRLAVVRPVKTRSAPTAAQ